MPPSFNVIEYMHKNGLMSWPDVDSEYEVELASFKKLFDILEGPIRIKHPVYDLVMETSKLIGPKLSYLMVIGEYEGVDFELIDKYIKPGDSALQLGGGTGMTAAFSAIKSEAPITVIESDIRLCPVIKRQGELNKVDMEVIHGCGVGFRGAKDTTLYLHEEIWRSTTNPSLDSEYQSQITVPSISLASSLDITCPKVLMVDIEGGEVGLFKELWRHFPDKILIEIHFPNIGEQKAMEVIHDIEDLGYKLIDLKEWTFYFERSA